MCVCISWDPVPLGRTLMESVDRISWSGLRKHLNVTDKVNQMCESAILLSMPISKSCSLGKLPNCAIRPGMKSSGLVKPSAEMPHMVFFWNAIPKSQDPVWFSWFGWFYSVSYHQRHTCIGQDGGLRTKTTPCQYEKKIDICFDGGYKGAFQEDLYEISDMKWQHSVEIVKIHSCFDRNE